MKHPKKKRKNAKRELQIYTYKVTMVASHSEISVCKSRGKWEKHRGKRLKKKKERGVKVPENGKVMEKRREEPPG